MVVLCAYAIELTLSYFPSPARYSFGWYAGRILGLVCSSLVLIVLLYEITTLYGRLLEAIGAQRREREVRLVTGDAVAANIAHEVNQPLSGMIASAEGVFAGSIARYRTSMKRNRRSSTSLLPVTEWAR
jgi:signal transduction histidine kinase